MFYPQLFEDVAKHVKSRGFLVEFERGPKLSPSVVQAARLDLSIPLPESLVEMYSEIGDGVFFRWMPVDPENPANQHLPFGKVEFEPIKDLVARHEEAKEYLIQYDADYSHDAVDDPELAKRTAQRMRQWLNFHDEGNGDTFSLDVGEEGCPVVFNQHDWMDGGTGMNGALMGKTLRDFMKAWSRVCFQYPSSLWWPSVMRDNRVDWKNVEFREPRLP